METGTVKWYNPAKGHGGITPDAGGKELFAQQSNISMIGERTLLEGQRVRFEIAQGPKGPRALNITLI